MSHQDIHYTGTEAEKDAAAIQDVIEWLGDKWPLCEERLLAGMLGANIEHWYIAFSMIGVRGYPVEALHRKYCK